MPGSPDSPKQRWTPLRVISVACAALGAGLRIDYALFHHHLRHRASSDALAYLERAMELLQRGAVPNLPATIWPPGTSALWAALSAMDPSQQLTAAWNAAASIAVMLLTAAAAGLLAGARAGWIALIIAALHPGFIHYNGFALAEQPFQLAIAIAMYLTLSALVRLESDPVPPKIIARAPARIASQPAPAPAPAAPPEPVESDAGSYIQAEVVIPEDVRGRRGGRLAPPAPGGGSAQGKWFGRFRSPSQPIAVTGAPASGKGFIGRARGAPGAAPAPAPRRSAFADRRPSGPLARPASTGQSTSMRDPDAATDPTAGAASATNLESAASSNASAAANQDVGAAANRDAGAAANQDAGAPANQDAGAPANQDAGAPANQDAGAASNRGAGATQHEAAASAANPNNAHPPEPGARTAVAEAEDGRVSDAGPLDPDARRTSRFALTGTAALWIAGAAIGCSWTLAALIRPNGLPVAAAGALALLLFCRRTLPARTAGVVLGAVITGVVVLGAAAHRCTATASGRFCLVSNNVAMNMALGQAGTVYGLEFRDPKHPELSTAWVPPSLLEHRYQGLGQVPASVYDTPGVLAWVANRFAQNPSEFIVRATGNAFDLFNLGYWPDEFGRYSERAAKVFRQAWNAAVFVPAIFALFALALRVFRSRRRPATVFVLGATFGLLLGAAISLGEARYRIPFDGLFIALASAIYAGAPEWSALHFMPAERLSTRHFGIWAQALAICAIAVIAFTHPDVNLGLLLPQRTAALPNRGTSASAQAADFAVPRARESTWNAPGNYVWQCRPDCGELRLRLPDRRRARQVSLSVDHNDRYRVLFYRGGELQGFADVAPDPSIRAGLQATRVEVPATARAGIDALGVQPLYGDGGYSLGHLIMQ